MLIVWMIYQFSIYKITFEWEWGIEQATLFSHFIYDRHVRVRQTQGWGHFHSRCMLHPLRLCIPKDLGRVFMKILKMKNLKVLIGIKKKYLLYITLSLSFFILGFNKLPVLLENGEGDGQMEIELLTQSQQIPCHMNQKNCHLLYSLYFTIIVI